MSEKKAPARLKLVDENRQIQSEANAVDKAVAMIDAYAKAVRLSWWQLGEACMTIQKNDAYKNVATISAKEKPYHSFEDFINRRLQSSRSAAYRAKTLREELASLNADDAARIPLVNAVWLLKLKKRAGESKWCNPKWIEKAQTLSEEDFANLVNASLPGAAAEEEKVDVKYSFDKSQSERITKAVKAAMKIHECVSEEEALEAICEEWLQSQCSAVTYEASNEEVFDGKKRKRKATKKDAQAIVEKATETGQKATEFNPEKMGGYVQ